MTDSRGSYADEGEIERIVRGFESCATPPAEFTHAAHLTVAFHYLHRSRLTVPAAAKRMRAGLYRFLDHHHIDRAKYHETITIFWLKLVRNFLDGADTTLPPASLANELIELCGDTKVIFDHYSKERLSSEEARKAWVEPDLKPLDNEGMRKSRRQKSGVRSQKG
jgi:hypothetical protein